MIFYVNFGSAFSFLYWSALLSRGEGGDVALPASSRDEKRRGARRIRPATVIWAAVPVLLLAIILFKANSNDDGDRMESALDDGRRSAVVKALNAGLPADYRVSDGETPLFEAVRIGDGTLVQALLSRGASVNVRSHGGATPLIVAVGNNRADLTEVLLDRAAVNSANNDGRTALIEAAMRGNLPIVQLLLAHGADRKRSDSHNKTALAYAQEEEYPEIAALLGR